MEQANMMMPNGMPANMNNLQRPQPGNVMQQMHGKIMTDLRATMNQVGNGWQLTCDLRERGNYLIQLVTQLRSMQPDTAKCLGIAQNFELKLIQSSPNKEVYVQQIKQKLNEITQKRREQANGQMLNGSMGAGQGMNPNVNPTMNPNSMNMPNNGMGSMNMNNGNMGMPNGQMNLNGAQQTTAFPAHLQRPMQPSPIPPTQQPATMDPSALQAPQMTQQMSGMGQKPPQQLPNQNMNQNPGSQNASMQINPQEIMMVAKRMSASMPEDQKQGLRQRFIANMTPENAAKETANGADPLMKIFYQKARENILKQRAASQGNQGMPQNGGMQMGSNQGVMGGNMQQPGAAQSGGQNFDFSGILSQQSTALKMQESGEQVVPASNNVNFAMGGQMNMPQGINPQMLQGNQQNNDQQINPQLQQLLREQQRQQQMQRQSMMAQQQAMAQRQQANQLRGQPGGLNAPNALNGGPAGQGHSPAMSMLNRPMVPPGQTTPGTPQANRPQGQQQTPMNAANQQLMQHHQQMLNQNNQQMPQNTQGPTQQQRMQLLQQMHQVPHQLRDGLWEKLQNMPPQQASAILNRIKGMSQANQMNGQPNQNGMPQNMGLGGMQPGPQAVNGMPQNMGNAGPGFNAQPPPNTQMENLQMQQRLHQQNQRHAQIRQQAMDARTFPAMIPKNYGMSVPQEVNTWGALKRHIMQNQAVLPPQTLEKVQATQSQWFELHPEELEQAMHALRQAMTGQQVQSHPPTSGPPNGLAVPNGQAPPAQMVPPTAPMQPNQGAGPGMNPGQQRPPPNSNQPSQQDLQILRQRNPQFANASDDQIRTFLWRRRMDNAAKAGNNNQLLAQQQALRAAQMRQAQAAAAAGQPTGNLLNGNPQINRLQPTQPSNQPINGQNAGQKRPQASNDDVMEIPNPNPPPMTTPQSAPLQTPQPQQQTPRLPGMPTKEQLQNMPPHERNAIMAARQKQYESLRKAQQGLGNNQSGPQGQGQPPANQAGPGAGAQAQLINKARAMYEEIARANPKGPPVQVDDETLNQAKAQLKKLWPAATRMQTTWPAALAVPGFPEAKVRSAMKARVLVLQNITDQNGTIKDYLSLGAAQLREVSFAFNQYFTDMKQIKDMQAAKAGQAAQAQAQPPPPPPGQRTPSAMAKPQQPQQAAPMGKSASQQGHGRKPSQNSKAPPAPTDNKPFDWGAPSPHGVPKYEFPRTELTPDKLKFPPPKKRKTGQSDSSGSTPAGQTATPGAMANASPNVPSNKVPSPEQNRKLQQQFKQEAEAREADRKRFKCSDEFCDGNLRGFETEDELKKHNEVEHQPVDDPLAFLMENAAEALGLDMEGQPKVIDKEQDAMKSKQQLKATPVQSRGPIKRDSTTTMVKQESATPGSGLQAKVKATPASAPPQETTTEPEQTMRELLEEKMGFEPAKAQIVPVSEPQVNEHDNAWADLIQFDLSSINGLEDWSLFDHPHVDLGVPPHPSDSSPSMTPSDASTSQSSRESDISQSERLRINFEWDAFGNGDTLVPEHLRQMKNLDLDESVGAAFKKGGEDVTMADADATGKGSEQKDAWDWSGDLSGWIYGDDAGLVGDGGDEIDFSKL